MSRKAGQGTEVPVGSSIEGIRVTPGASAVIVDAAGKGLDAQLIRLFTDTLCYYRLDGGIASASAPSIPLPPNVERYEVVFERDEKGNLGLSGIGLTVFGTGGALFVDIIK